MVRVEVIDDLRDFTRLRSQWDTLAATSTYASPFACHAAIGTWFEQTAANSSPHILTAWEGDELVATAPFSKVALGPFTLYVSAGAGYGFPANTGFNVSSQAISQYLSRAVKGGRAAFYMRRLRLDSDLFIELSRRTDLEVEQLSRDEETAVVKFGDIDDVSAYFERASKKHQIPRLYRRLNERFNEVSHEGYDQDPEAAIKDLREMQRRTFGHELRIFATASTAQLTQALACSMIDSGNGRFSALRADGNRIASALLLELGGRYWWYAVGYDPEYRRFGLGHIDLYETLRRVHSDGGMELDLGDAGFDYKGFWATRTYSYRTLAVTSAGVTGSLATLMRKVLIRLHRWQCAQDQLMGPSIV